MNKEEAIMILQNIKPTPHRADSKSTTHILQTIALEMAIKALEREPSGDLISRQELLEDLYKRDYTKFTHRDFVALVQYQDTVQQEPKTGHWVKYGKPRCDEQHYKCTACDYYINFGIWGDIYTKQFKYCPNCGAKMIEPQESEDK